MQQTIDFLPERIKIQRARRQRLIAQGYVLALGVIVLGVVGYMRHGHVTKAKAELVEITDRTEKVQTKLTILNSLERQQAELMIKKRISDHLGSRVRANDVMAELQPTPLDRLRGTGGLAATRGRHRDAGHAGLCGLLLVKGRCAI